jgi:hypothetical protein
MRSLKGCRATSNHEERDWQNMWHVWGTGELHTVFMVGKSEF